MPQDNESLPVKLSPYQVNVVVMLGDLSQMSSTNRKDNHPKGVTWEALLKKGVVEYVPLEELSFNRRANSNDEKWLRLTELGNGMYLLFTQVDNTPNKTHTELY